MKIKDQKIIEKLGDLIEESEEYYEEADYHTFVEISLKAWDILPIPKEIYDESYHIAEGLAEGYLLTGNHKKAIKWAEIMGKCDMERADDGQREFILGKMLYEGGNLENAKEKFELAMTKSEGRAFINEPKKYIDFLKKNNYAYFEINDCMDEELDDELYVQIENLAERGNVFVDQDDYVSALNKFQEALAIIPEPKVKWEVAFCLYVSIGDMYLFLKDYKASAAAFYNAINCPDEHESAFVLLRLGEALFEMGERKDALDNLLTAYMLEGKELFKDEEEKYIDFLKNNVEGIK